MKKLLFISTIFAVFATMSCGSESTTSESTDQTEVMDTTLIDTIGVQVDTGSVTSDGLSGGGSSAHEQPIK
jgi:uncharacterized protein YcfL